MVRQVVSKYFAAEYKFIVLQLKSTNLIYILFEYEQLICNKIFGKYGNIPSSLRCHTQALLGQTNLTTTVHPCDFNRKKLLNVNCLIPSTYTQVKFI